MSEFTVPCYFSTLGMGQEFSLSRNGEIDCREVRVTLDPDRIVFIKEPINQAQEIISNLLIDEERYATAIEALVTHLRATGCPSVTISSDGGTDKGF
jgi:hypothetical protein